MFVSVPRSLQTVGCFPDHVLRTVKKLWVPPGEMMVVYCIRLALTVHEIKGKVGSLRFHSLRIEHRTQKWLFTEKRERYQGQRHVNQAKCRLCHSESCELRGGWECWLRTCESDSWQGFQLKWQFLCLLPQTGGFCLKQTMARESKMANCEVFEDHFYHWKLPSLFKIAWI